MAESLTFRYDRTGDILHIDKRPPYPEQESEEVGDEVVARLNPSTGEVESLEVLFFSTRLLRGDLFELPVSANLRLASQPCATPTMVRLYTLFVPLIRPVHCLSSRCTNRNRRDG